MFPLCAPCYFILEFFIHFTWPGLCYVGNFSYTLCAHLCGSFPYAVFLLEFRTYPVLCYLGSFYKSYTQHAFSYREFLLHAQCCIMW